MKTLKIMSKLMILLTMALNLAVFADTPNIKESFRALMEGKKLVNISKHSLDAEAAEALADVLKNNDTVVSLDLSKNNIGDKGVQALAELLKNNKTLEELILSRNNITKTGVEALVEALKVNKTLKELDLSENDLGDDAQSFCLFLG